MRQQTAHSIDYGVYIDDTKTCIITDNEVVFEWLINDETHESERIARCFSEIMGRLTRPFRILIFGPSGLKYELYTFIDGFPALGYTVKEVFITAVLGQEAMTVFVKKHFDRRISL